MDITYVLLLVLAGMSFFLGIEWLMLASIFLFVALVLAKYYSDISSTEAPAIEAQPPMGMEQLASQPTQSPIIVVNSGGTNAATITDQMISTMMGTLMAMDVYEQDDTPPIWGGLQRGRRMRQGMFDHHGKYGSKHKMMNRQINQDDFSTDIGHHRRAHLYEKLDKIGEKLGVDRDMKS